MAAVAAVEIREARLPLQFATYYVKGVQPSAALLRALQALYFTDGKHVFDVVLKPLQAYLSSL
jgi:hypothetical protein